jgi:hypothetical protein
MLELSSEAEAQLRAFEDYYAEKGYETAYSYLIQAMETASDRVLSRKGRFYNAPRPYPELADYGFEWLIEHRYWIAIASVVRPTTPGGRGERQIPIIAGIFFDSSNIPGRVPKH